MDKNQYKVVLTMLLNTYEGILLNHPLLSGSENKKINYFFDCKQYEEIIEKYNIDKIAGNGSEFVRCKRLLHYLSPRLTHNSYYDNHIKCNALDLLEYSLNNPEHGINCLNKSKIFAECALALGIMARRVAIMPYSPYDCDNHVIAEIYDNKLEKWIMMDPTTDGYFIDENKIPLSMLEIRDLLAHNQFITFVPSTSRLTDMNKLRDKYLERIVYIAKNSFYFMVGENQRFGDEGEFLCVKPSNFNVNRNTIINYDYIIADLTDEYETLKADFIRRKNNLLKAEEPLNHSSEILK